MRTNATFRHPAKFIHFDDNDSILSVPGAQWIATLLRQIPGLEIDANLCQEDWGVALFGRRSGKTYWIGVSAWTDEGYWLIHFHHGSFAWWQRFSSSGKTELERLLVDANIVLAKDVTVSDLVWYEESDMRNPQPRAYPTPV